MAEDYEVQVEGRARRARGTGGRDRRRRGEGGTVTGGGMCRRWSMSRR